MTFQLVAALPLSRPQSRYIYSCEYVLIPTLSHFNGTNLFIPFLSYPQGLVDLDAEIAKAVKKLSLAQLNLDKILKIESQAEYESTVPDNVRLANEEKVSLYCIDDANVLKIMLAQNI